jgi:hypothetical protein
MEDKEKNKIDNVCRAAIDVTIISDDFDFICVATPLQNGQVNRSYENDEYFNQVLMPTKENTRIERLESGLPLFDNHPYDLKATSQLGISVGYDFTERGLELKMKFGARADEALRNDVKNGIIKTVSIEGDIYSYEVSRELGKLPTYKAIDWEPTSISFAPVPQDIAAQIEVKRAIKAQLSIKEQKSNLETLIQKFKK